MSLRICSKDLLDEGVLGRWGKEVVLFEKTEVLLTVDGVGEDVKIGMEDGRRGRTSNDVLGTIRNVEEGVVFNIFKGRPDKLWGWRTWDRSNG